MKTKLGWYKINDIWHHVGDGNGPANWRPEFHSISTFLLYILIHPVLCLYSINMLHDFYERIAKSTDNLSFSRILLIPHFLNRFHFSLSFSLFFLSSMKTFLNRGHIFARIINAWILHHILDATRLNTNDVERVKNIVERWISSFSRDISPI